MDHKVQTKRRLTTHGAVSGRAKPTGKSSTSGSRAAPEAATRSRILDAAEALFAVYGFHAVSLRDITAKAKVNGAAIFYHFGHKEDLFAAVIERRSMPLEEERRRRLDLLLNDPKVRPTVEALIEAYVAPGLTVGFESAEARVRFGRLRARITSDSDPRIRDLLRRYYREPGQAFLKAIADLLPQLSPQDLQWRFHLMVGTIIYMMGKPGRVQAVADMPRDATYDPDDMQAGVEIVVQLLAAMFRAPALLSSTGKLRPAQKRLT